MLLTGRQKSMRPPLRILPPLAVLATLLNSGCTTDTPAFSTRDADAPDAADAVAVDASAADTVAFDQPPPTDAQGVAGPMVRIRSLATTPQSWRIGGVWVFTAPVGSASGNFVGFRGVLDRVLAPQHRYFAESNVIGHTIAHDGPYAEEVERALREGDWRSGGTFTARDFRVPYGIYSLILIEATAAAARVRAQDGDDRPAIATALFPITVRGSILREGRLFDPEPSYATLGVPPSDVAAGLPPTHLFNILANTDEFGAFGAVLSGHYALPYTLTDASGAGYQVDIEYDIVCDEADRRNMPETCGVVDAGVPRDVALRPPRETGFLAPCVVDSDCSPAAPTCLHTYRGGATRTGYCSTLCGEGAPPCPTDNVCVNVVCVPLCELPAEPQNPCHEGSLCAELTHNDGLAIACSPQF